MKIKGRADFSALMADGPFEGGAPDAATTFTLTHDDWFPKAVGGFVRERNGVFTLWGYCGADLTRRDWIAIADHTRRLIADLFLGPDDAPGAHRVQALARCDNDGAVKYLLHLGLRNDLNRLVAYGPEAEDYVLLAAIKGMYGQ